MTRPVLTIGSATVGAAQAAAGALRSPVAAPRSASAPPAAPLGRRAGLTGTGLTGAELISAGSHRRRPGRGRPGPARFDRSGAAGFNHDGWPATTSTTASQASATARFVAPSASVKARPSGVVGTSESPTSGLTSTSRAALDRTAAASSSTGGVSSAGLVGRVEQHGHPATQVVDEDRVGAAPAITSASRRGSPAVSSVSSSRRRARCASRFAHSVSSGSPAGAVAR
ncbi:hypothetical protein MRQ36_04635 [Micromonospora sp. R77]|nr:hypothetical protein [Micromonospora sp. R77]MCI4061891.1 hypothetical protein [Micromonospora sp. R77]